MYYIIISNLFIRTFESAPHWHKRIHFLAENSQFFFQNSASKQNTELWDWISDCFYSQRKTRKEIRVNHLESEKTLICIYFRKPQQRLINAFKLILRRLLKDFQKIVVAKLLQNWNVVFGLGDTTETWDDCFIIIIIVLFFLFLSKTCLYFWIKNHFYRFLSTDEGRKICSTWSSFVIL